MPLHSLCEDGELGAHDVHPGQHEGEGGGDEGKHPRGALRQPRGHGPLAGEKPFAELHQLPSSNLQSKKKRVLFEKRPALYFF